MPVIQALGGLRQEDLRFKASMDYIASSCLKQTNKKLEIIEERINLVFFPVVNIGQ
jgi:hypothetical protein